ncbi:(2Fe-2S)-binding protein [Noviherbaspirillum sp.]|uniref:(2Fe-2S)-binding protein n=1 Tax=Noviherbaspirillum sp. TaxID=1926288 RepID=UPI002D3AEBB8|nr:(2Fe-2S)-binding protein [Noviherbaspirillum sp.]HZW23036.1 (2Fe-2S)-binding protein [Noviherbaspirillum sp.]
MIVCVCNNVSERQIRRAVDSGHTTMPQLREELGVGTCCGKCHSCAKTVLREYLEDGVREAQPMFQAAIAA